MSDMYPSTNERDPLDALLDRALATYTPVNARPGLEDRVRARIAVEPERALEAAVSYWRWAWIGGIALGAALLLMGVLRLSSHHGPPLPITAHTVPAPPAPQQGNASPRLAGTQIAKPRIGIHHVSARTPNVLQRGHTLQRGPSQQQLIAQLLASNPGAIAIMARGEDPSRGDHDKAIEIRPLEDKSLEIEPIQIKPLDESPASTGGR